MTSSPERYNLRSRKNPPEENPIHAESFPSSQSESSTSSTEENTSSDKSADETDAAISCVSDITVTENSKDSHVDKTSNRVKSENKSIRDKRKNSDTGNQSPLHTHQDRRIKTELWKICIIPILLILWVGVKFGFGIDVLNFHQINNQKNQYVQYTERPVAYRLGNLTTELEHIKAKYTTLDDGFWDVIAGSSWGHIQGDGSFKRPVVLLLVGQPKSSNLDVVANDVARLYSNVFTMRDDGTIHIDGGWQAMKEADQAKLDMDNLLKNGFSIGRKVVLVTKFDKLPPCSIMLFHSYCDNDNAPHKDAVIIFTVELETTVSNAAQPRSIEELVQQHLGALWEQCPEELLQDKIMAMHSRVSNNIAFVK